MFKYVGVEIAAGAGDSFLDNLLITHRTDDMTSVTVIECENNMQSFLRWRFVIDSLGFYIGNPFIVNIDTDSTTTKGTYFKFDLGFRDESLLTEITIKDENDDDLVLEGNDIIIHYIALALSTEYENVKPSIPMPQLPDSVKVALTEHITVSAIGDLVTCKGLVTVTDK